MRTQDIQILLDRINNLVQVVDLLERNVNVLCDWFGPMHKKLDSLEEAAIRKEQQVAARLGSINSSVAHILQLLHGVEVKWVEAKNGRKSTAKRRR